MIDVRFPRRVDANGNTVEEYHPISMSLDLNIKPLSTATMQLPWDENIPARSFVELFTPFGSAGFFRVRSPEDAYGEDMTSVELEHAITEVGDYLVKAKYEEMMAANTAMQTVFSHYGGGRWQLGSVAALGSGQIALSANYDRVLDAMLAILEQKPECYLAFDFSTTPWTVSVATKDTTVSAEGRLSRNVDSAKVIYDDTELCTRVYYEHETTTDSTAGINLDGVPTFAVDAYNSAGSYVLYNSKLYLLPNGHESGETWANTTSVVQNNIPTSEWVHLDADTIGTYGVIERRVSTGSNYTGEEARKVAQEYLRTHKKPKATVRVQAEELSNTTGESWDTFTIGKLLRLALVDYNVTVSENITGLSWDDVCNEPESMEVVLGDEEDTAIKFLHDVDSKGGSGGGGGGKKKQDEQLKEYRTIFEKDDYHFRLAAQRLNTAQEILKQAGLYIDSNGNLLYVDDFENNIASRINQTAGQILQSVDNDVENLSGRISLTDRRAAMAVGTAYDDAHRKAYKNTTKFPETGTAGYLYIDNSTGYFYKWEGGQYVRTDDDLAIKAGEICVAINQSGQSTAKLDADRILAGRNLETTLADLELPDWMDTQEGLIAEKATIVSLNALSSRVGTLETDTLRTASLYSAISNLDTVRVKKLTIGSGGRILFEGNSTAITESNVANFITNLKVEPNGNQYTLYKMLIGDSNWTAVGSFSRATSLSGAWSGGTFTVTASPQGNSSYTEISDITITLAGITYENNYLTVPVTVKAETNGGTEETTGYTHDLKVYAKSAVDAGYASCHLTSSWDDDGNSVTVSKTTSGSTNSVTFAISAAVSSLTYNTSTHKYSAVAQAKVNNTNRGTTGSATSGTEAWEAGKTDGYASCHLTSSWDEDGNSVTVSKTSSGSTNSVAFTISAAVSSLTYNTTTHKYSAVAQAKVDNTNRGTTGSATSGTEAWDAGYLAGWNAAVGMISRSQNVIIGPKASNGSTYTTETKYTANYTASKYTASKYTASSHNNTRKVNNAVVTTSTTRSGTKHSISWGTGGSSYTSQRSDADSNGEYYIHAAQAYVTGSDSYTASSYTKESYTASSFSWS